mmetsp:Transcript_8015/g.16547  ORF Transcript_8015/g.16547 Transcript_8015/m.16547 type:complete len:259 (-) Transcript_8015:695-1471(-)
MVVSHRFSLDAFQSTPNRSNMALNRWYRPGGILAFDGSVLVVFIDLHLVQSRSLGLFAVPLVQSLGVEPVNVISKHAAYTTSAVPVEDGGKMTSVRNRICIFHGPPDALFGTFRNLIRIFSYFILVSSYVFFCLRRRGRRSRYRRSNRRIRRRPSTASSAATTTRTGHSRLGDGCSGVCRCSYWGRCRGSRNKVERRRGQQGSRRCQKEVIVPPRRILAFVDDGCSSCCRVRCRIQIQDKRCCSGLLETNAGSGCRSR